VPSQCPHGALEGPSSVAGDLHGPTPRGHPLPDAGLRRLLGHRGGAGRRQGGARREAGREACVGLSAWHANLGSLTSLPPSPLAVPHEGRGQGRSLPHRPPRGAWGSVGAHCTILPAASVTDSPSCCTPARTHPHDDDGDERRFSARTTRCVGWGESHALRVRTACARSMHRSMPQRGRPLHATTAPLPTRPHAHICHAVRPAPACHYCPTTDSAPCKHLPCCAQDADECRVYED
jgi:hypothetical protein